MKNLFKKLEPLYEGLLVHDVYVRLFNMNVCLVIDSNDLAKFIIRLNKTYHCKASVDIYDSHFNNERFHFLEVSFPLSVVEYESSLC